MYLQTSQNAFFSLFFPTFFFLVGNYVYFTFGYWDDQLEACDL